MSAIYDLLSQAAEYGELEPEYWAKMMHKIPPARVVTREQYLLDACQGKVMLDIGGTGPMAEALYRAAREYHAIDLVARKGVEHFYRIDIDRAEALPEIPGLEIVVAGEVIEHLSNAGHFLELLKIYRCPIIVTTPNAFSESGNKYVRGRMIECVNGEHVAYYSYHTLKTLVERHGWLVNDWAWYNGRPGTAEGMVFNLTHLTPRPPSRHGKGEQEGEEDA